MDAGWSETDKKAKARRATQRAKRTVAIKSPGTAVSDPQKRTVAVKPPRLAVSVSQESSDGKWWWDGMAWQPMPKKSFWWPLVLVRNGKYKMNWWLIAIPIGYAVLVQFNQIMAIVTR